MAVSPSYKRYWMRAGVMSTYPIWQRECQQKTSRGYLCNYRLTVCMSKFIWQADIGLENTVMERFPCGVIHGAMLEAFAEQDAGGEWVEWWEQFRAEPNTKQRSLVHTVYTVQCSRYLNVTCNRKCIQNKIILIQR